MSRRPAGRQKPPDWTDRRIARLKYLVAEGLLTAAEIADDISGDGGFAVSRLAVIGKIRRLGLTSGRFPGHRGDHRKKAPPAKAPRAKASPRPVRLARARGRLVLAAALPVTAPLARFFAVPGACQWIEGERAARTICGAPVAGEGGGGRAPYCPHHMARAYRPAPPVSRDRSRARGVDARLAWAKRLAGGVTGRRGGGRSHG